MEKMKRIKSIFSGVLLLLAVTSCVININSKIVRGNGVSATKSYDVTDFQVISIHGSLDVVYSQVPGAGPSVVLTTDENLMEYYVVSVNGGVLDISQARGVSVSPVTEARVVVSSSGLNGVRISGSGDCDIRGALNTDSFFFKISGSGNMEADNIVCNTFEARISGSGDIEVDALSARTTDLSISGSGDIEANCVNAGDVMARISGSGDITLRGRAERLSSKVSGSGDVDTRELQIYQ